MKIATKIYCIVLLVLIALGSLLLTYLYAKDPEEMAKLALLFVGQASLGLICALLLPKNKKGE